MRSKVSDMTQGGHRENDDLLSLDSLDDLDILDAEDAFGGLGPDVDSLDLSVGSRSDPKIAAAQIFTAALRWLTTGRRKYLSGAAGLGVFVAAVYAVFQALQGPPMTPEEQQRLLEDASFAQAVAEGDIERLEDFLEEWPNSRHQSDILQALGAARNRQAVDAARQAENDRQEKTRDEAAWQQALTTNTDVAFRIYAAEFPHGAHSDEVRDRRDDLAFARAEGTGTFEALLIYRQTWPDGRHIDKLDDAAWQWALRSRSPAALDQYAAAFPAGRYVGRIGAVKQSYMANRAAERQADDDRAWVEAQRLDSRAAYQHYLDTSPDGAYRVQARDAISRVDVRAQNRAARRSLVSDVQRELVRLGYDGVKLTGTADEGTSIAVQAFETWSGGQKAVAVTGRISQPLLVALRLAKEKPRPGVGVDFKDCLACPEMRVVPGGSFVMGSAETERYRRPDEAPRHRVRIAQPFAVGKYEVTFAQWDACVQDGGCSGYSPDDQGWGRGARPVIYISWSDAQAYVAWLRGHTGQPYRLLTEAEWEYVARAGTTTAYSFGADADTLCRYSNGASAPRQQTAGRFLSPCHPENYGTAPVGSYSANSFGLHDLHGNVQEWVEDCWRSRYTVTSDSAEGRKAVRPSANCDSRVTRGGAWGFAAPDMRSAARLHYRPEDRFAVSGFRVAMDLGT